MAAGHRIAGTAYLKVDGVQYALKGGLTISPDPVEREGIAGMDGVHGYSEKPRVPSIKCELSDSGGLSLEQLRAITDATVTAEVATGKVYVLTNAWTKAAHELDAADGKISVEFMGFSCREMQ